MLYLFPEAVIFCHGSTVSTSLETQQEMYAEGISIAVCVISKMYQNNNLRSFLNSLRVPVVVFEEKNSAFGALEQTVLRYASRLNYHFKIQSNEHMPLVPSSSYMESEMLPDRNHLQKCLLSVMR